ncbi:hypothetical protein PoB_004795500 [Plakobranchus ocellatus]|uniref:Uncharacterized protein n=1 Tax=Plakobranchus ocellatus TaxID=259542 RepID=A0AAV4BQR8_9GAST|nr:hypothetical protein PoB_004795500 [Plakobranchus ocellatus]
MLSLNPTPYRATDFDQGSTNLLDGLGENALPVWLTDNKDTTCNPDYSQIILKLKIPQPSSYLWIRLDTRHSTEEELSLETELGFATLFAPEDYRVCSDGLQIYVVRDGRSFDLRCSFILPKSYVYLEGSIVAKLCSLYISEGREIVPNQPPATDDLFLPDDEPLEIINNDSKSDDRMTWDRTFNFPVTMEIIIIDCLEEQANLSDDVIDVGLHLWYEDKMFIADAVFKFTAKEQYAIIPKDKPTAPITRLEIVNQNLVQFFNLCEVRIFGEQNCPPKQFGLNCSMHCKCQASVDDCDIATGHCRLRYQDNPLKDCQRLHDVPLNTKCDLSGSKSNGPYNKRLPLLQNNAIRFLRKCRLEPKFE